MRRGLGVAVAALCVGALGFGPTALSPVAHGDDTTTTVPGAVDPTSLAPAARGAASQVTPTVPPPVITQPVVIRPTRSPDTAPADSGTGRRAVYSKGSQRVWLIGADNVVQRSYLVSGRLNQPNYGTYAVYSRSGYTCSLVHPNICMRWMVRFTTGPTGDNIGFHEIPRKDGVPVQTDSRLGTALSGGCVRQATADAQFMWNWASIGTKVVVIP